AGTDSWRFNFDSTKWMSDQYYYLKSRAFDKSAPMGANGGNEQPDPWTLRNFTVDGTAPVSSISTPVAGAFITSSLATISGTTYGGLSGLVAGAGGMRLRIFHDYGGTIYFWRGTTALGWSTTFTNLPVTFTASAATTTWTYPAPTFDPPVISTNGQVYQFVIEGVDLAGNLEVGTTITVTADFIGPSVTLSTPMAGANAFYGPARQMPTLIGDAIDAPAGIQAPVYVQVSNISEAGAPKPKWDGGSSWIVVASSWLIVGGEAPWSLATPTWTPNKRFKVESTANDNAGNPAAAIATREFIYDVNKPSSTLLAPTAAFHNAAQVAVFSGSALDWLNSPAVEAYSGLAPAGLEIQIVAPGGNTYNGATFDTNDNWRPVNMTVTDTLDGGSIGITINSTATWVYPTGTADTWPPAAGLTDNNNYKVRARARDRSGNQESYVEKAFTYDSFAPTTTVTSPGALYYTTISSMVGSISDLVSGINPGDGVQVAVQRDANSNWWNGTGWDIPANFAAGTHWKNINNIHVDSWTWTTADSNFANLKAFFDTLYGLNASLKFNVYVRGRDVVGNNNRSDAAPTAGGTQFTIDPITPSSIVTWPVSGSSVTVATSTFSGSATDVSLGVPSGLNKVRVRLSRRNLAGTRSYYNWSLDTWSAASGDWTFEDVTALADPLWRKDIPITAFTGANSGNGYAFDIQSEARDNTQPVNGGPNIEFAYSTTTFVIDLATPTITLQLPAHNSYFRLFTTLQGTATDYILGNSGGGIASDLDFLQLDLMDSDRSPAQFWNFGTGAWQAGYSSTTLAGAINWSKGSLPANTPTGAASWAVGRTSATFVLRGRAVDRAGNNSAYTVSQATFTLDLVEPDSLITTPSLAQENTDFNSLNSIVGTAADFTADVSTVQIRIQQDTLANQTGGCTGDANNEKYWNGTAWQAGEIWMGVNTLAAGNWTFNSTPVTFFPQCFYLITSSAVDNANNGESTWGTRRFRFTPPPSATLVVSPPNAPIRYQNTLGVIEGTANANTTSLQLTVRRSSDNYFWNFAGSNWQAGFSSATIVGPPANWSYSTNLPFWVDGSSYVVMSSGTNASNIPEPTPTPNVFYSDQSGPATAVVQPSLPFYRSLPLVTGTAVDPPGITPPAGGVNKVQARIAAVNGEFATKVWDNVLSTFVPLGSWSAANNEGTYFTGAASSWSYVVSYPTAAWINGTRYSVEARSVDNAYVNTTFTGNTGAFSALNSFDFDTVTPTATLTAVSVNQRRSSVVVASGTIQERLVLTNDSTQAECGDTTPAKCDLQIAYIRLHIRDNSQARYWDGLAWDNSPAVSTTAVIHRSSWSTTALPAFTDRVNYTMWVEAEDRAGNVQQNFTGNGSSVTFIMDKTAPTIVISSPAAGSFLRAGQLTMVTGTANDPDYATNSGLAGGANIQVQISYLLSPDTYYYDNNLTFSSTTPNIWNTPSWAAQGVSSGTWTYAPVNLPDALISDKSYRVLARVQDNAYPTPNPATLSANVVSNLDVVYDTTTPTSLVVMPAEGAFYERLPVTSGTVNGDLAGITGGNGSKVEIEIRNSNNVNGIFDGDDTYFDGAAFVAQQSTVAATLVGGPNGTFIWEYTVAVPYQNRKYRITSTAIDLAGNVQAVASSATFTFNLQTPLTSLSVPFPATARYSVLPTISGTASDPGSGALGIKEVHLRVKNNTVGAWWDGVSAVAPAFSIGDPAMDTAWVTILSTSAVWTNWSYNFAWTTGRQYTVVVRAKDNNDVFDTAYSTSAAPFTYDTDKPESAVDFPAPGTFLKSFAVGASSITGTSADLGINAGNVQEVRYAIRRNTDGNWWDSVSFPDSAFRDFAVSSLDGSGNWTYGTSLLKNALTSGVSYYITTQARDQAVPANQEAFFNVRGSTFVYDIDKPSTTITGPIHFSTVSSLASITGTTSDNPGESDPTKLSAQTEKVQLTIQRYTDGLYYTGGGWGALTWLPTSTTAVTATHGTWIKNTALPAWAHNESYWIVARSSDSAGNLQSAFTVGVDSRSVTFDLSAATATITIFVRTAGTSYYIAYCLAGSSITGTVVDSPAGIELIEVAISSAAGSDATPAWYDGTAFNRALGAAGTYRSTTTPVGAVGTWNLVDATMFSLMQQNKTYKIKVRTTDKAIPANQRTQDFTVIYDIIAPTGTITTPAQNISANTPITLGGGESDAGGVGTSTVAVSIRKVGTNNCYTGVNFASADNCPNWIGV
ncbi:MAG: hypothetical protein AAB131_24360, partial [Actinomycetota bacterium]